MFAIDLALSVGELAASASDDPRSPTDARDDELAVAVRVGGDADDDAVGTDRGGDGPRDEGIGGNTECVCGRVSRERRGFGWSAALFSVRRFGTGTFSRRPRRWAREIESEVPALSTGAVDCCP